MREINQHLPEGGWRALTVFMLSILPALIAAAIVLILGREVYLSVLAVVINYYFVVGVGWITSPVVGLLTGMNPIWLLILLVFISMESSLIVSVNYDLLEKIPLLGRAMRWIRTRAGKVVEKHSLAADVEYMTLFWLMFIPIYGTGPMMMSFVGRILSLEWWKVWLTITVSSIVRYTLLISIIYLGILSI